MACILSDDGKEYILFYKKIIRHKMKRIQSKKHKLGTYEVNKKFLSCFNGKRYIVDDGIIILAYFHKNVLNNLGCINNLHN